MNATVTCPHEITKGDPTSGVVETKIEVDMIPVTLMSAVVMAELEGTNAEFVVFVTSLGLVLTLADVGIITVDRLVVDFAVDFGEVLLELLRTNEVIVAVDFGEVLLNLLRTDEVIVDLLTEDGTAVVGLYAVLQGVDSSTVHFSDISN